MFTPAPIQEIKDELLEKHQVRLLVKREDLIHPLIKGNKWYKLKYNLENARKQGFTKILTFGGAFSNHIYATASAGYLLGFQSIGIIRGEEHLPLNPVLSHAVSCGMEISYLDRATYRKKNEVQIINYLKEKFGDFYLVPEGGTTPLAVKGTKEILQNVDVEYNYVCCACGTGGTLAGLVAGASDDVQKIGFAVLKGEFLQKDIENLLQEAINQQLILDKPYLNWYINNDYHFGGYAKVTTVLQDFVQDFSQKCLIPIEPIYTGKLFYGILDLISKGFFQKDSIILAIHSGGVYS
ncbi:MAG: pyridoxal-phosphate dependent enzyme [Thermoflexibacter sp.]